MEWYLSWHHLLVLFGTVRSYLQGNRSCVSQTCLIMKLTKYHHEFAGKYLKCMSEHWFLNSPLVYLLIFVGKHWNMSGQVDEGNYPWYSSIFCLIASRMTVFQSHQSEIYQRLLVSSDCWTFPTFPVTKDAHLSHSRWFLIRGWDF